jgi:hypothetical protein
VTPLVLYRDDGLLARAVGALVRVSHSLLIVVALVPVFAVMIMKGDGASHAAVAAALAWFVLLAAVGSGTAPTDRFRWIVPPLLRLGEYSALLWIGALAGEDSQPAAFALVCALAFRHYDLVYRLRNLGTQPPPWVGDLALGWDGRVVLGYILLVAGALPAGFFVAAGLFATMFVAESIAGWRRFGRAPQPVTYEDEEDEAF